MFISSITSWYHKAVPGTQYTHIDISLYDIVFLMREHCLTFYSRKPVIKNCQIRENKKAAAAKTRLTVEPVVFITHHLRCIYIYVGE